MAVVESPQRIEPARLETIPEAVSDLVAELSASSATLGKARPEKRKPARRRFPIGRDMSAIPRERIYRSRVSAWQPRCKAVMPFLGIRMAAVQ